MQPTEPRLSGRKLRIAEDQPQYEPVTVVLADNRQYPAANGFVDDPKLRRPNTRIMAFRLTDEDRRRIAAGADVYVAMLTYGNPQQPILLSTGPELMAEIHGLEVTQPVPYCPPLSSPDATGSSAPTDSEGPEAL